MKIELTDMAAGGDAVGRYEGMAVFVPLGVVGEVIEATVVEQHRTYARAAITQVLQASPQRVMPRCQHFGSCGGCQWQHIDYATQLQLKTDIVRQQLTRIGKLAEPNVLPCVPSPTPYGYRNHARLVRSTQNKAHNKFGYRRANSHDVVEIVECPILEPELEKRIKDRVYTQDVTAISSPSTRHGSTKLAERPPPATRHPLDWNLRWQTPTIRVGSFEYHVSAQSFFQANTAIAEALVQALLGALALQGSEKLLDLYCGVGLFTLPLAQHAAYVLGVEANAAAIVDAEQNRRRMTPVAGRIEFICAPVEKALESPAIRKAQWDAVVLDPPRNGIDERALRSLCQRGIPKIVYVSCDPATLARDVHQLCQQGYQLHTAQPFDMFPQTHHVETLAVLGR